VTWRLRCNRDGSFPITLTTSDRMEVIRRIRIKQSGVF
jgi:hypothetical protein